MLKLQKKVLNFFALSGIFFILFTTCCNGNLGFKIKPVLQIATSNSIGIIWETYSDDKGVIKISKNVDMSGYVIYETSFNRLQKFIIDGLEPGTRYYYQVTAGGEISAINTFKTAFEKGCRQKFRFIVYGDTRTNHDDHLDVCVSMIEEQEVNFVVHTGDFADKGSFYHIVKFFDIEKDFLASNPILPVYGNHEVDFYLFFDTHWIDYLLPASGGTWSYYYYSYGNLFILVLDTNQSLSKDSTQYKWAEDNLMKVYGDEEIDHIMVSMHEPVYSSGKHGDLPGGEVLADLFEEYGVKVVFQGHDHNYERLEKNGIIYITSGGGGAPLYRMCNNSDADSITFEETLCYVIVNVDGKSLNFQAKRVLDGDSSTIEEF